MQAHLKIKIEEISKTTQSVTSFPADLKTPQTIEIGCFRWCLDVKLDVLDSPDAKSFTSTMKLNLGDV